MKIVGTTAPPSSPQITTGRPIVEITEQCPPPRQEEEKMSDIERLMLVDFPETCQLPEDQNYAERSAKTDNHTCHEIETNANNVSPD